MHDDIVTTSIFFLHSFPYLVYIDTFKHLIFYTQLRYIG